MLFASMFILGYPVHTMTHTNVLVSCLCRLVEQYPSLLDVESFETALEDAKMMMPNLDLVAVMTRNPEIIFGFQRRGHMIPYDD